MPTQLYVASTPRHLYQAAALAFARDRATEAHLMVFGMQPGTPLMQAARSAGISPFASVHEIEPSSARSSGRLRNFRGVKDHLASTVLTLAPERVVVGNDFKPYCQWIMHHAKRSNPACECIYADEGTASHIRPASSAARIGRALEGALKTVLYGPWYRRPAVMGTSRYIDFGLFAFPEHVLPAYDPARVRPFDHSLFRTPATKTFVASVLETTDFDPARLGQLDVIVLIPFLRVIDAIYGDRQRLRSLLASLVDQGLRVGVKYHPRDAKGDSTLDGGLKLDRIPSFLPAEMLYSSLREQVRLIGDMSSALLTARWLLPDADVFAVTTGAGPAPFSLEALYRKTGVQVTRIDALLDRLT